MRKILAMLLAVVMVLGMSVTALAAEHKPVKDDHAVITVNGVKTGATIKAYKIAEGQWNDFGFTGYSAIEVGGVRINDLANPTAEEVTTIANAVDRENGGISVTESDTAGVYMADLQVGMYLILVTKNATDDMTAYNPMIASVYYSTDRTGDDNEAIGGAVSAEDDFEVKGQAVFAKSMNPEITKKIVESGSGNEFGDDTAIGDEITFEVKTAFPGYSDEYTKVEFNIIDTLSKGLTLNVDSVTVTEVTGATPPPAKGKDYTVKAETNTESKETTMTLSFTSDYILANRGKDVTVRYTAVLNADAGLNFDKNTNTVKAEYTNNPTTGSKGETDEKRTYHYTFGIDASINGSWDEITKELLKTGEELVTGSTTEKAPLDGATFTLTSVTDTTKVYTTISGKGEVGKDVDADGNALPGAKKIPSGYLKFTGLDAGEYVLQETKAPEGYSLNPVEIPVKIEAEYNTEGTLMTYKITVDGTVIEDDGVKTSIYTADYKKDDTTGDMNIDPNKKPNHESSNTQKVPNTKIIGLPSTGGIGTTIFTIGGCAIMIMAAGLFFATRRKKAK